MNKKGNFIDLVSFLQDLHSRMLFCKCLLNVTDLTFETINPTGGMSIIYSTTGIVV